MNTIYVVEYLVTREGWKGGRSAVTLTEGYTEFEDIRKIIAIRRGLEAGEVVVINAHLVLATPVGEHPTMEQIHEATRAATVPEPR
jgi:hypothetical protein